MNCEETTYTVFLIDGAFADEDVDILRFDGLDWEEVCNLVDVGTRQDFDIVVRAEQTTHEGGTECQD